MKKHINSPLPCTQMRFYNARKSIFGRVRELFWQNSYYITYILNPDTTERQVDEKEDPCNHYRYHVIYD